MSEPSPLDQWLTGNDDYVSFVDLADEVVDLAKGVLVVIERRRPIYETLVDDEPDLGYVRYVFPLIAGSEEQRPLSVLTAEHNSPPWSFVPLFYFEEDGEGRRSFDRAFLSIATQLAVFLGTAARSGEYSYPHRPGWSYSFAGWCLPDATLVLVQDEFDIQFGMDVTLWGQPAGSAVIAPIHVASH